LPARRVFDSAAHRHDLRVRRKAGLGVRAESGSSGAGAKPGVHEVRDLSRGSTHRGLPRGARRVARIAGRAGGELAGHFVSADQRDGLRVERARRGRRDRLSIGPARARVSRHGPQVFAQRGPVKRSGFAWYELLMSVAAVGSVTALSIPMYEDYGRQAIASEVLADIDSIRAGVFRFYSDSG